MEFNEEQAEEISTELIQAFHATVLARRRCECCFRMGEWVLVYQVLREHAEFGVGCC